MGDPMAWLIENWPVLVQGVTGVVTLASAVTALTKTPKDDAVLAAVRRVLDALALNVGNAKNARRPGL